MILLLTAVETESSLFRKELKSHFVEDSPFPLTLFRGNIFDWDILLAHTGIGKTNASAAVALLLAKYKPQAVILSGCAGAYPQTDLQMGDIVVADGEFFADEGVQCPDHFADMREIGFPLSLPGSATLFNHIPLSQNWCEGATRILKSDKLGRFCCHCGRIATVSSCSGSTRLALQRKIISSALCENMEGAAVAAVCHAVGVPLLQIRGISNYAVDRDQQEWDVNTAVTNTQQAVLSLLENDCISSR